MNFFGHAVVARWVRREPRFVLGAMLPDFASMCRARFSQVGDPQVAAGVEFHHRTDGVFHATPTFLALQREALEALEAEGVGYGPARAVAHVGVELAIDGELLADEGACADYLQAVAALPTVDVSCSRGQPRFDAMAARATDFGLPDDYRSPRRVAERLERILAPRPRLAFANGDVDRVARWLERARPGIAGRIEALLDEVRAGLSVDTPARDRAILPHPSSRVRSRGT